jgi:hypothetical protein
MILAHFGINNQTFINGGGSGTSGTGGYGNGKKPAFFHDAWNEYAVILPGEAGKFSLSLGAVALLYGTFPNDDGFNFKFPYSRLPYFHMAINR